MDKKTYKTPQTAHHQISMHQTLLQMSPKGMPILVTNGELKYRGPGGDAFESDESVATKEFFNVWEQWEE